MATFYILRNDYDVDVQIKDPAWAAEMQQHGWKLITTFTEETNKEDEKNE